MPLDEPPRTPHAEPPPDPDTGARLTGCELVVLQLLARGYSLAQCAQLLGAAGTEVLGAAEATARKLGVRDSTEAVLEAYRLELIV